MLSKCCLLCVLLLNINSSQQTSIPTKLYILWHYLICHLAQISSETRTKFSLVMDATSTCLKFDWSLSILFTICVQDFSVITIFKSIFLGNWQHLILLYNINFLNNIVPCNKQEQKYWDAGAFRTTLQFNSSSLPMKITTGTFVMVFLLPKTWC